MYRQVRKDWYDELRYDSHEKKYGRPVTNPHVHVKLGTPLKPDKETIERELSEILENIIPGLEGIVKWEESQKQ